MSQSPMFSASEEPKPLVKRKHDEFLNRFLSPCLRWLASLENLLGPDDPLTLKANELYDMAKERHEKLIPRKK